jgi:hypothetical protein
MPTLRLPAVSAMGWTMLMSDSTESSLMPMATGWLISAALAPEA